MGDSDCTALRTVLSYTGHSRFPSSKLRNKITVSKSNRVDGTDTIGYLSLATHVCRGTVPVTLCGMRLCARTAPAARQIGFSRMHRPPPRPTRPAHRTWPGGFYRFTDFRFTVDTPTKEAPRRPRAALYGAIHSVARLLSCSSSVEDLAGSPLLWSYERKRSSAAGMRCAARRAAESGAHEKNG